MYIYNETTKPYSFKHGEEVSIIYRRATSNRPVEQNKTITSKRVHILAHESVVTDSVKTNIENAVCTTEPMKITEKESVLYFSKKDLTPFVTALGNGKSTTLLVTLKLKDKNVSRRVVSIDNPYIFVLKSYVMGGELTVVSSFVEQSRNLTITLLEGNDLVKYTFKCIKGEIKLVKTVEKNTDGATGEKRFKPKSYIPSRMTHAVLCYGKDKESLEKIIPVDKKDQHSIIEITNKTLEEQLIHLKQDNYNAVTIFVDRAELDEEAYKIYRKIIGLTQKHLRIVMVTFNTGEIKKIKY